jgi:CRISPR-associated protein Csx16
MMALFVTRHSGDIN